MALVLLAGFVLSLLPFSFVPIVSLTPTYTVRACVRDNSCEAVRIYRYTRLDFLLRATFMFALRVPARGAQFEPTGRFGEPEHCSCSLSCSLFGSRGEVNGLGTISARAKWFCSGK